MNINIFKKKRKLRTTLQYGNNFQILEGILYTPFEKVQCKLGHFTNWKSFDAISDSGKNIQRFIRLIKEDKSN